LILKCNKELINGYTKRDKSLTEQKKNQAKNERSAEAPNQ